MAAQEVKAAVHEEQIGTLRQALDALNEHLVGVMQGLRVMTRWIVVIFIVSLLLDDKDPLIKLLGTVLG